MTVRARGRMRSRARQAAEGSPVSDHALDEYLFEAEQRGALHQVDGRRVVLDVTRDPVTDEQLTFLSYADDELWLADSALTGWLSNVRAGSAVVVRSTSGEAPSGRWRVLVRHVLLDAVGDAYVGRRSVARIRRADGRADDEFVAWCLAEAIRVGYAARAVVDGGIAALVDDVMEDPSRRSWVAEAPDGERIGQLTVRSCDDNLSLGLIGARTELVDTYATQDVGAVIDDLLTEALPSLELPVAATVTSPAPERERAILAGLASKGWRTAAVDWASLDDTAEVG
ncbi:hypothetical protein [Cellulomonas terrae]|uniref:N-acetyltransferase domain-containing protein n=1 Tax=Cellulomonas terrae TaxID=311234 RepID=A0A511JK27_9CELL|nr:hypothetical protein [Cellulomonas terrae]GEL98368.1 hypothetical protein CTE05_19150 [Cellulomonas terrae]